MNSELRDLRAFLFALLVALAVIVVGMTIAKAVEPLPPCTGENMQDLATSLPGQGMAYRPLTASEIELLIAELPLAGAEGGEFTEGLLIVNPANGMAAISLGRGGFSCGHALLDGEAVLKAVSILAGQPA